MNFPNYGVGAGYPIENVNFRDINTKKTEKPFPFKLGCRLLEHCTIQQQKKDYLSGAEQGAGIIIKVCM